MLDVFELIDEARGKTVFEIIKMVLTEITEGEEIDSIHVELTKKFLSPDRNFETSEAPSYLVFAKNTNRFTISYFPKGKLVDNGKRQPGRIYPEPIFYCLYNNPQEFSIRASITLNDMKKQIKKCTRIYAISGNFAAVVY